MMSVLDIVGRVILMGKEDDHALSNSRSEYIYINKLPTVRSGIRTHRMLRTGYGGMRSFIQRAR